MAVLVRIALPSRCVGVLGGYGGDVESREQRDDAVALIVMAAPRRLTRAHRQHGLAPVERLDVRLLVDAKHGGVGRGRDVEAEGAGKGGGVFMPARDAGS